MARKNEVWARMTERYFMASMRSGRDGPEKRNPRSASKSLSCSFNEVRARWPGKTRNADDEAALIAELQ